MRDENGVFYSACIVGNIIGPHYWGEKKEVRYGTKHFRPGAKLYCAFVYGGRGHERVRVFGKPRRQRRMVDIAIDTRYIKNFRGQKMYDKGVLAFINKYGSVAASQLAEWLPEDLNSRN